MATKSVKGKKATAAKSPYKMAKPAKKGTIMGRGRPRLYAYDSAELLKALKADRSYGANQRIAKQFKIPVGTVAVFAHRYLPKK